MPRSQYTGPACCMHCERTHSSYWHSLSSKTLVCHGCFTRARNSNMDPYKPMTCCDCGIHVSERWYGCTVGTPRCAKCASAHRLTKGVTLAFEALQTTLGATTQSQRPEPMLSDDVCATHSISSNVSAVDVVRTASTFEEALNVLGPAGLQSALGQFATEAKSSSSLSQSTAVAEATLAESKDPNEGPRVKPPKLSVTIDAAVAAAAAAATASAVASALQVVTAPRTCFQCGSTKSYGWTHVLGNAHLVMCRSCATRKRWADQRAARPLMCSLCGAKQSLQWHATDKADAPTICHSCHISNWHNTRK